MADKDDRTAYPGRQYLADTMRCSTNTVDRARESCKELGVLTWRERRDGNHQQSHLFYLPLDQRKVSPPTGTVSPPTGIPSPHPCTDPLPTHEEAPLPTSEEVTIPSQQDPLPIPKNKGVPFVQFWKAYPRSEGKAKAEQHWKKMTPDERDAAFASLPLFALHVPDKTFMPHGSTWLNQRRWEDELDADGLAPRVSEKKDVTHRTGGSQRGRDALERLRAASRDATVLELKTKMGEITDGK